MSIATVSLKGELSWATRNKHKLTPTLGLSRVARSLAAISQEQKVTVKAERGVLTYFNERTQNWSTVKGSGQLGQRLEGSLGELTLEGPVDSATLKSTFRALLKQPLPIMGNKLSKQGIAVKGTNGEELKFPITWNDLKKEIVWVNFDFKSEHATTWGVAGALITGFIGFLNTLAVSQLGPHISLFDQPFCSDHPVIFMGGAALAGGVAGGSAYLIETLGRLMVWVPTRLHPLARFSGDYKAVFAASNGHRLDLKEEKTLERVLREVGSGTRRKILEAALSRINDSSLSGEIDRVIYTYFYPYIFIEDYGIYLEKIGRCPNLTAQTLARILSCEKVIPKSKKVVDKEERTETRLEEYDTYGMDTYYSYEVEYVAPEESHYEYNDQDVAKAQGLLKGRDQNYIRQTLAALETSGNQELAKALRASLFVVDA